MKVIVLSPAREELVESAYFYLQESPPAALNFDKEMNEAFSMISKNPYRYRVYSDDIRVKELDRFPFSIYYRIKNTEVHILSIAHNSRMPDFWKERAE